VFTTVTYPSPTADQHVLLRRRIREALAAELLPLGMTGSATRPGSERPCFICDQLVLSIDLEREVSIGQRDRRLVTVHEPCYLLWRVESMVLARVKARLPSAQ